MRLLAIVLALIATPAAAQGDLSRQEPIVVRVELQTDGHRHFFEPNHLTFKTGKLYRLVLHNPSDAPHYFTSPGLADRVFTRKVEVVTGEGGGAQRLAEIKGNIREIEVFPGGTAEWWFVPVATVEGAELHCNVKDEEGKTHAERGMVGTIDIQ
jgi:uncharacterized cupredoxin-like copper-binding protein